jgi:uncharacterized protein (TIGR02996 family)
MNSDERGLIDAVRADPDGGLARLAYADWLDDHGRAQAADFVRLHLALRAIEPDHLHWAAGERELSELRRGLEADWLAAIEPDRLALPETFERPHCRCVVRGEGNRWKEPRLHRDVQDTECDAWKRLIELIEDAANDGRDRLDLRQGMSWPETMQIVTLPPTIARLKGVRSLELYSSHQVRIPPEIGQMTALEDFDPYTSYRLHWFPYEITRCKSLVRSRVSTRALYGNYKNAPPFPRLTRRGDGPAPGLPLKRVPAPAARNCSVCDRPFADAGRYRAWITLRVATDDLPLLVNACSRECIDELPVPPEGRGYAPCPHGGGLSPKHFRRWQGKHPGGEDA